MNPAYFTKSGPIFSDDRLAVLPSLPQWQADDVAGLARHSLRDIYEKHTEALRTDAGEPQTKFFLVNPALHALGYVYSISESIPVGGDHKVRADYTLFESPESFVEVEPVRGTASFFRNAIGLAHVAPYNEALEVSDDAETAAQQPMVLMDLFLRSTGVDFGIVTNGVHWRMLHRATSDGLNTYLDVNLPKLIQEGTDDDFKAFFLLFGKESLKLNDEGTSLLTSFLP